MTPPPDLPEKDALIAALVARIEALVAQNASLVARIAELEAKLGLPPKTPGNSSVPPSKGQKPPEPSAPKGKAKPHAGAHRPLHPNPTARRDVFASACQESWPHKSAQADKWIFCLTAASMIAANQEM